MRMTSTTTTTRTSYTAIPTKYLNNSEIIYDKVFDAQSSNDKDQVGDIVETLCPHLFTSSRQEEEKTSVRNDLVIKPLTGGLSNELFVVTTRNASSVLVRIHPSTDDENDTNDKEVVDRNVENKFAAWLSEQGLAPTYYGRFQNGRVEEFYPNVVPLTCHEMQIYGKQIAKAMAAFHNLNAPETILPKHNTLYKVIQDWFRMVFQSESVMTKNRNFLNNLQEEWDWLYTNLQTTISTSTAYTNNANTGGTMKLDDIESVKTCASNFIREVVVTHMDIQSLNILKDDTDRIRIIDFEYAGWNPRAADIANTFCEYCDMNNIKANYEKEYPNDSQQNEYLIHYVREANSTLAKTLDDCISWEPFLEQLRLEIGRFSLLSHLGWSVWSLVKSTEEQNIDFDYVHYAQHRMEGYRFAKNKFFGSHAKRQRLI